jgi:phytoene synthase
MNDEISSIPSQILETQDALSITKESKSNFSSAFLFLPKHKRIAISRVYAFFRVIDDVVDEEPNINRQIELINSWKRELKLCYQGTTIVPLLKELSITIKDFDIPLEYFEKLIEGCEMDITKHRYANFEELYEYCYRVASMVGLVCLKIFEADNKELIKPAIDLGLALQLTNIIRDVGVDTEKNRIYLPEEDLKKFKVSENAIFEKQYSKEFFEMMNFQYQRALDYYQTGLTPFKKSKLKNIIPATMMGEVYFKLLKKIRRNKFPVLHRRVKLNLAEKMSIFLKMMILK